MIGAGVTGLTAAWRLQQQGVRVSVFEAGADVGGQVRTVLFQGRLVEVGAEGLHLANPATAALLGELGLLDSAVEARSGGTWLEVAGRLRRLPAGVGPAGPTRLWPVATSGVLSASGLVRAALEPLFAHHRRAEDVSVGEVVAERFGQQVVDRLVDPLLGGIHAGDVRRLSLRACAPQLVPAVEQGRSLAVRRKPASTSGGRPPALVSWDGGLRRVVDTLSTRLTEPVRLSTGVATLHRDGSSGAYAVRLESGDEVVVDAVVIATPARVAAQLLSPLAPSVVAGLDRAETASVATVLAALPGQIATAHPALAGTGMLVPRTSGRLLRAATFMTSKWPHLAGSGDILVRLSAGRAGQTTFQTMTDDDLTAALLSDLGELLGVPVRPEATAVHRWPSSMPQQNVGHGAVVERIRGELTTSAPGVAIAGASFDGVGVAACLRSGELAAELLLAAAPAGVPA